MHSFAMQPSWLLWVLVPALGFGLLSRILRQQRPLPPGPRALPLIGNTHQLAKVERGGLLWKVFDSWFRTFGPIIRVLAPQGTMIVLGDWETAHELLDRRAANFSSRPRMPMANELLFHGHLHFVFRPYGDEFKLHRRMMDSFLTPGASRGYRPVYEYESLRLLQYLLNHCCGRKEDAPPETKGDTCSTYHAFRFAASRYVSSVILMIMYGYRLETGNEPSILKARQDNAALNDAMARFWPCDVFPWLNRLPEALAPWKQKARQWHSHEREHHLSDLAAARHNAAEGRWNLATAMLNSPEAASKPMTELEIAFDAGTVRDAAVDTTTSALTVFLLAATAHPEKTMKAQRALDAVVGRDRLPGLEDRPALPYIMAFLAETMRWRPGIPGGVLHSNLHEDEYRGYRIPKGSMVMVNIGSISADKAKFGVDAGQFRPERYMDDNEEKLQPRLPIPGFGFGRRNCMGQHVAKDEMFVAMARLLWAFDFVDCQGEGTPSLKELPSTDTLQNWPVPFGVRLVPRHDGISEMVKVALASAPADVDLRPAGKKG